MKNILFITALAFLNVCLQAQPNHTIWNALLQKHVTADDGQVNYQGFIKDKAQLNTYIENVAANPPKDSWTKEEQMAYWINAYNAFTIKLIVDKMPVKSIMDINNGKPWDLPFITIGGKKYTLNNIENDILRPKYKDPRIHFAINCASKSCPKLLNKAFTAATLNADLESQAKHFVNNKQKNTITAANAQLSKIFEWFADDFKAQGGIVSFINEYSATKISSSTKISYKEYSWELNN